MNNGTENDIIRLKKTWVVPCGKQQKTASTLEKSASLTATKSGKSCKYRSNHALYVKHDFHILSKPHEKKHGL